MARTDSSSRCSMAFGRNSSSTSLRAGSRFSSQRRTDPAGIRTSCVVSPSGRRTCSSWPGISSRNSAPKTGRVASPQVVQRRGGAVAESFKGVVNVDIKESVPDWEPYTQPMAPPGSPNVVYIVLDDVGFSAMEPFGGMIETPNINRIADRGLTYTNFHTTALCSPTRSCLMTGRNHTTNGMATITEAASGYPSSNGHIPFECGTIAEVLGESGFNTYMVGKWHLTAEDEMNLASRKSQWPVGRGFERFYGFLGAETNQWYPDLTYDNHHVEQPATPEEGYHFSVDITDKALSFIRDAKA